MSIPQPVTRVDSPDDDAGRPQMRVVLRRVRATRTLRQTEPGKKAKTIRRDYQVVAVECRQSRILLIRTATRRLGAERALTGSGEFRSADSRQSPPEVQTDGPRTCKGGSSPVLTSRC